MRVSLFITLALYIGLPLASEALEPARQDLRVPMRDGITLAADVWTQDIESPLPVILLRTPYGKSQATFDRYGLKACVDAEYAVVMQDTRGTGASEGEFDFYFPEGNDGYDTIEWIAAQPWCNGKVGTDGGSFLGTVQWLAARERPPHLVCMATAAPSGDLFGELPYVGGAFHMGWALNWLHSVTGGAETGLDWQQVFRHRPLRTADELLGDPIRLYREILQHPTMDDYWRRIHFTPEDFSRISIPVLVTTGWFDGDQAGALFYWRGFTAHGPKEIEKSLIVGPWLHAQTYLGGEKRLGPYAFGEQAQLDLHAERLEFFDRHLKGEDPANESSVRLFLLGANEWREYDTYPPEDTRQTPLYFRSDERLSPEAPNAAPPDTYTYDPDDPAPFEGGANDHRSIESRPDVLTYTSPPLTAPLEILGHITARLHVSSTAPDTDFMVRLVDVFPDGRAINLTSAGGVIRTRYREGFDRERLMTPGELLTLSVHLQDLGIVLPAGHRIRVEVTSSAWPYIHPNPNTGNPIATDTESQTAVQTIYHDADQASHILLPVIGEPPRFTETNP